MKQFLNSRIEELEAAKRETNIILVLNAINKQISKHKEHIKHLERWEHGKGKRI